MTYKRIGLVMLAAAIAVACDEDTGPTTPQKGPVAFVRYVNAVPDTGAADWRPIDRLEDSPPALGLAFRGVNPYQAMGSGSRRIRIFPTSTNIAVTSQVLLDTTITFQPNTYYTLIYTGMARANTDQLQVIQDSRPTPSSSQVGVRVINAGLGLGALDVLALPSATGTPAATFSNLAVGAASDYTLVNTGPLILRARVAGTSTVVVDTVRAPVGDAGGGSLDPVAGSTIGGSLLTAIVVPRAVAGSQGGSSTTPTIIVLQDNRPPRP